jgi:RNA polymerase sigma factor (sigma-70 family)
MEVIQANVISASEQGALRSSGFPCSISLPAVMGPAAWHLMSANAMGSVSQARSDADARRSALMAAAQRGDRAAYETLLRDCVPFIAAIARRRGVPPDRADDVVQETLLTIHRARATYDPRRSFDAWLRVIVERRAVDVLRQAYRHGAREVHAPLAYDNHADEDVNLAAGIERRENAGWVQAAVAELPKSQRDAVRHLMLEEKSLDDAAALTGRSKGSLKVNLHRALKALRLKFDPGADNG